MNLFRLSAPLLLLFITACQQGKNNSKETFSDPVLYCKTVKQLNNVVLENNFPPMIANRNYTYANIAAYEVVVLGDTRFQSLAGQIKHLPAVPAQDTANVNFNYAALLAFCKVGETVTFPEGSMQEHVNKLDSIAASSGMSPEMITASKKLADSVANHILRWSRKDNYAQTRSATKYTITNEDGSWVPTPPMYAQAVEPHWREIRPMVLDSASQFIPPRPPVFDVKNKNSEYYRYLLEVKNIGDSLTDEQKHIADFWDDNPFKLNVTGHFQFATKKFSPPGHWMNIVGIGAEKAGADFSTTVAAYTETAIALFDAFISCWDEKYRSNYVRPETIINKIKEFADWRPYIQTPPFPSYTSGHATNSAAAAEVMTNWFGDKLSFVDTSLLEFGIKNRTIQSFRRAAEEAAMSRLYGGIHYRFDNENGADAGRKLGEFIVQRLKLRKKPA
ncbi:MAG: phosphatase PAP2 family protein [Chitinophagaceae bacterium]|nr:MAG: phosphatase PAP2 family protein [Chitinophagaceae bacterium]